mmetsp:Transcript_6888/g.42026  ORF Transcript_6888/g.42026 Transcript_6888/m.42026 type:complete len:405 (+) Transcript_6888:608-1822(+)
MLCNRLCLSNLDLVQRFKLLRRHGVLLVHIAHLLEPSGGFILFLFQLCQPGVDFRIDEVGNVLAIHDLWYDVPLPLRHFQVVRHVQWLIKCPIDAPCALLRVGDLRLLANARPCWMFHGNALHCITVPWHRHVSSVFHVIGFARVELLGHAPGKKLFARKLLDIHHPVVRERAHRDEATVFHILGGLCAGCFGCRGRGDHVVDGLPVLLREVFQLPDVRLVARYHKRLVDKQGLQAVKQGGLLGNGVSAFLRHVYDVQSHRVEMGERGDALHFNGVSLFQGSVQDPRGVDDLPSEVSIVCMADVERLGGEGVGLHVHVGSGHFVEEAALSHVRVSAHDDGSCVWIDGRKPGHVLPDLFEVGEAGSQFLDDGAHASERGSLELFAAVEGVSVLEQLHVFFGHFVH